jgi:hypothetical protein
MMAITIGRLHEFMRLYEEEFGEPIKEDEAREIALRLLELYQLLARPLPSEAANISDPDHSDGADRGSS